jgi:hypothetical protein
MGEGFVVLSHVDEDGEVHRFSLTVEQLWQGGHCMEPRYGMNTKTQIAA